MNLLLTNDDGIYAEGLWALYHQFSRNHRVTVVAPDREQSGVSHGFTLRNPLRETKVLVNSDAKGHAVNGTPADCVKLAVAEILEDKPDLVISGINHGQNIGVDIHYSGTVGAAKEASLNGIPAIAVSVRGREVDHYPYAAHFLEVLAEKILNHGLPFGTFLNVNIPNLPGSDIEGVVISRQGIVNPLAGSFEKRVDPWNRVYYWQGDYQPHGDHPPDSDRVVVKQKYISVTPIKCDMTDYHMVDSLKEWKLDI